MAGATPIDVHVGKRLRFGRTMQGMSQEAIGEAIGVTFQQIQKYERGVNCIRASKLFELAKILKVPVAFFFEGYESEGRKGAYSIPGAGDSAVSEFEVETGSNRETLELMRAFQRIDDTGVRGKTIELLRAIADNKAMV